MKKIVILLLTLFAIEASGQKLNAIRDSLYLLLHQTQDPSRQIDLLTPIAHGYWYSGQPDSSRHITEQILKIATRANQDSLIAQAYLLIGVDFSSTSDYRQSLEYKFRSLALAEKSQSIHAIWLASKEVGVDFKELKNFVEALKYLKKAESLLETAAVNNATSSNRTYTHLAEVFLGLEQLDSALRYIQLANEGTFKEVDAYGYARVLYIFATVHKENGDFDIAESYYKKCIAFSDAESIYSPYVSAATDYGQYLFDNKQYDISKIYALSGFDKAKQANDKLWMINSAALLRKVYFAIGQKDSSYFYADIKDAYSDSVFNEQQLNQIRNLSFSQLLKEREEQEKLADEKIQRNQNIQFALIGFGIISFIIIFLLLSRSFITNTRLISFLGVIALLIVFEFLNLLLHPFLERVTHHSPVLMLLALVCIAALLVPLHHRVEKWATHKLVEKNKQIRLADAKRTIEKLETNN